MIPQTEDFVNNNALDLTLEALPDLAVINLTIGDLDQAAPIPNPARNTMSFEDQDVNFYNCRICFEVNCENFENLQIHFELKHPVEQRGDDFYQNNKLVATYKDNVCILTNCTYSKTDKKKFDRLRNIQRLRYRLVLGGDYSGFKGFLPWADEFEQEKALMICVENTENVKNYGPEIVSNFIKTYGIMATLRPQQFNVPMNGKLLIKSRCPFASRNRQIIVETQNVIEKLDNQMEVITNQNQIVVEIRNHQINNDTVTQNLEQAQLEILEQKSEIEALKMLLSTFEKEKAFVDEIFSNKDLKVVKNLHGEFDLIAICPVCTLEFGDRKSLTLHCQKNHTVHIVEPNLFLCHLCAHSFETRIELDEHMQIYHPTEWYPEPESQPEPEPELATYVQNIDDIEDVEMTEGIQTTEDIEITEDIQTTENIKTTEKKKKKVKKNKLLLKMQQNLKEKKLKKKMLKKLDKKDAIEESFSNMTKVLQSNLSQSRFFIDC